MKKEIASALIAIGMLMVLAGLVIPIFTHDITGDAFRYIYAAGALMLLTGRLFTAYKGDNMRVKRLSRIEGWCAIFFCVAAFLLFYDKSQIRDAIAFTLAGALIQIYTSIMIPRLSK